MKIHQLIYWSLLVSIFFLSACSNDDNPEPSLGNFTFEGRSFNLSKGFLITSNSDTLLGQRFAIALTSSGISYNSEFNEFSGSGNFVLMDLRSPEGNIPSTGVYEFGNTNEVFTFFEGGIGGEFDFEDGSGRVAGIIISGSIGLDVTGDTYTFNLSLGVIDAISGSFNAVSVNGNYAGPLEVIPF